MTSLPHVWCVDPGLTDFSSVHRLQLDAADARASGRLQHDLVFILEHTPVFTVGRRGNHDHLKVSQAFLEKAGLEIIHIERGGDITYHGPGQLVLYPIFRLTHSGLGVVDFVCKLEEVMLRTAKDLGVPAVRDSRNHGIWVGDRKLGFVGIAVRRGVSFHGISLNVDLSLEPFTWIDPCGLEGISVSTLNLEASNTVSCEAAKRMLLRNFANVFSVNLQGIKTHYLEELIQSKQD